jgi:hypothetical protein
MDDDELLADPVLGGIVRKLNATQAKLDEAVERVSQHDERLKTHEDTWTRRDIVGRLGDIAERHHRRFGKPLDPQRLIGFALQRNVPDLEVAYRALTLDDAVAAASAEAEERGKQRGRRERHHSSSSGSPWGAPSVRPPHLGGVESLQELTDEQVLADPDIRRAMSGDEE